MEIKNKTPWRTDHLRAIIKQAARSEMVNLSDACFTIRTRRQSCRWAPNYAGGWARYGMPPSVVITMPDLQYGICKTELAKVIAHELAHSQNVRHRHMKTTGRYKWGGNWREIYAWAELFPLEAEVPEVKSTPARDEVIQKKLSHALKMAERWKSKVKASQTWLKKWNRKVTYYDKRLLKAATQPEPTTPPALEELSAIQTKQP